MKILITNDDGITSPGILLLAEALREVGHTVYIAAPDKDRSGSSHSITFLNEPCKLTILDANTWSCSGTPVDCVIVALLGGIPEICIVGDEELNYLNAPDLILSGINSGANLGTDILYSGTAAGARQGSLFGIPSVSLSLVENHQNYHWESAVSFVVKNLDRIKSYWEKGAFVNVNLPNIEMPNALIQTFPSNRYYNDCIVKYTSPENEVYCFTKIGKTKNLHEEGSDWEEVLKGNAAFSLIKTQPVC
jgi:5'-nucleotidase